MAASPSMVLVHSQSLFSLIWFININSIMYYNCAEMCATDEAIDRNEEKRDAAGVYRTKAYDAVADLREIGAADVEGKARAVRNRVELI